MINIHIYIIYMYVSIIVLMTLLEIPSVVSGKTIVFCVLLLFEFVQNIAKQQVNVTFLP